MDPSHMTSSSGISRKFPLSTFLFAVAILAGAAAILVFKIPVLTVLTYGLLGMMLFGCSFMHAGHSGHNYDGSMEIPGDHAHPSDGASSTHQHMQSDGPAPQKDEETTTEKDPDPH